MRCELCGRTNGGVVFVDRQRRHHPICWVCRYSSRGAVMLAARCDFPHPADLPPRCLHRPFLHHRRVGRIHPTAGPNP